MGTNCFNQNKGVITKLDECIHEDRFQRDSPAGWVNSYLVCALHHMERAQKRLGAAMDCLKVQKIRLFMHV
jgi:hypothetical protein